MSSTEPDMISPSEASVRTRNPRDWKKAIAKEKRDAGQEYVIVHSGKRVPAKQPGPPCTCKKKCNDKIGRDNVIEILVTFGVLGTGTCRQRTCRSTRQQVT